MIYQEGRKLIRIWKGERLQIEAFHKNSLRVRATRLSGIQDEDWALLPPEEEMHAGDNHFL